VNKFEEAKWVKGKTKTFILLKLPFIGEKHHDY
jgi:uncharacterized Fe-S cluster-containing MiaB family protein